MSVEFGWYGVGTIKKNTEEERPPGRVPWEFKILEIRESMRYSRNSRAETVHNKPGRYSCAIKQGSPWKMMEA